MSRGRVAGGMRVSEAARQAGVSRQTVSKRLARARRGEPMSDRPSRPRRIAGFASLDVNRVTGEIRGHGPATPVRHGTERPGELLRVDVKKVARVPDGGGHTARSAAGAGCGTGASCLHVVVDDFNCVAHAELLPDERKGTCAAFMARCLALFAGLGVPVERAMTDNGPGYRSDQFNDLLGALDVRRRYARPYSPRQNGKVERMNRTLAQEWQYGRVWEGEAGRASALPAFIEYYNWERPHGACRGLPPMSRIPDVTNLLAHNN